MKVQIRQMEFIFFFSNYRNKVSFLVSHLPKNSFSRRKCPAILLHLRVCAACVANRRGSRKEKGSVHGPFSMVDSKTSWRRERQGRRLVASLGWVGQGPGWQGLREQGATSSLAAWGLPVGLQLLARRRSQWDEHKVWLKPAFLSTPCFSRPHLHSTGKSQCFLFTNAHVPFRFWIKVSITPEYQVIHLTWQATNMHCRLFLVLMGNGIRPWYCNCKTFQAGIEVGTMQREKQMLGP